MLLGATGFTGNRVLRKLLAAGDTLMLVGRNGAKMSAATAHLGVELPVVEVDMTSTADPERVFTSNDVLLSTVGPFMKLGLATVTAAAHAGVHYLDSSGEATFVRRVFSTSTPLPPCRGRYSSPRSGTTTYRAISPAPWPWSRRETGPPRWRSATSSRAPGLGDELRYRSTLRDAYTLTTGATRGDPGGGIGPERPRLSADATGCAGSAARGTCGRTCPHLRVRRCEAWRDERGRFRAPRLAGRATPSSRRWTCTSAGSGSGRLWSGWCRR